VHRKWRVFVEDRTNLPKKIEWYAKTRPEDEYVVERFVVVAYPSEAEIQDIILNIFGPRDNRPDDPEYIGTPGALNIFGPRDDRPDDPVYIGTPGAQR